MNILFLSVYTINSIEDQNIYSDLLRKFRDEGHNVYIATPCERKNKKKTNLVEKRRGNSLNKNPKPSKNESS